MTSFIANTTAFISHQPETVFALLATSRPLMNSSIVPVILSNDELWDALSRTLWDVFPSASVQPPHQQEQFLALFSSFSDTMQFTSKLRFQTSLDRQFAHNLVKNLVENKRYFAKTLSHLEFPSVATMEFLAGKMWNIRTTTLMDASRLVERDTHQYTDNSLKTLCRYYPRLETLTLSENRCLTNDALNDALSNLRSLRELVLDNTCVTSLQFLRRLPHLKKLDLRACTRLASSAFDLVDETTGEKTRLPILDEVGLGGCDQITEDTFKNLAEIAPHLSSLTASDLRPECITGLLTVQSSSIRNLYFFRCQLLNIESIELIFTCFHSLEDVRLGHFDGDIDSALGDITAPLRSLQLDLVTELTDVGLSHLFGIESLEKLLIYGCRSPEFTGEITLSRAEIDRSSSLKELCLGYCPNITDRGIQSIFSPKPLPSLRMLNLQKCGRNVTSEGLETAFASPMFKRDSLETLAIHRCEGVQDLRFLRGLSSLKELSVDELTGLDFSVMRTEGTGLNLLSSTVTLEKLELDSIQLDDDIILHLPETVKKSLKYLSLYQCTGFTDRCLSEGVSKMTSLECLLIHDPDHDDSVFSFDAILFTVKQLPRLEALGLSHDHFRKVLETPQLQKEMGYLIYS